MIVEEEEEEEGEREEDIMLSLHLPLFIVGIQSVGLIPVLNMTPWKHYSVFESEARFGNNSN